MRDNDDEDSCAVQIQRQHIVASELKDPICHSNECQIGSSSSEATYAYLTRMQIPPFVKYKPHSLRMSV